jgi:hypothetical protein
MYTALAEERYTFVPDQGYVVEGENAPKYMVVEGFFFHAINRYKEGDERYKAFLGELGIAHNSAGDTAITKATFALQIAVKKRGDECKLYHDAPDDVFNQVQFDTERTLVHTTKKIYVQMLKELQAAATPPSIVEDFLEQRIRPTVTLASSDPPIESLEIMDLLEKDKNCQKMRSEFRLSTTVI